MYQSVILASFAEGARRAGCHEKAEMEKIGKVGKVRSVRKVIGSGK
jgi:hypothetical protein